MIKLNENEIKYVKDNIEWILDDNSTDEAEKGYKQGFDKIKLLELKNQIDTINNCDIDTQKYIWNIMDSMNGFHLWTDNTREEVKEHINDEMFLDILEKYTQFRDSL